MRSLGFAEYVPAERQSNIITAFRYPDDPNFRFEDFYHRLRGRGFVIYPGKLSQADCFRIGTIGHINEENVRDLLAAMAAMRPLVLRTSPPRSDQPLLSCPAYVPTQPVDGPRPCPRG